MSIAYIRNTWKFLTLAWYDRTILHDFESALCFWAFFLGITALLGSLLRTIFGPMPEFYCWWIIFCRNVMGNGMQLSLDCNIIFRVRILWNQTYVLHLHILLHNLKIFERYILMFSVHLSACSKKLCCITRRFLVKVFEYVNCHVFMPD